MLIKKYPLQLLFILSLACLLSILGVTNIFNFNFPFYWLIILIYLLAGRRVVDYCKEQKDKNKFIYYGSYIIVLTFAAILMWYMNYIGDINVQKYIDTHPPT